VTVKYIYANCVDFFLI